MRPRINSKFVRLYKDFNARRVRGGGYVGILDDQRLVRQAVVDAAMHDANIFQDRGEGAFLGSALAWADMLVLDADLAVSTVNHVAEHAHDNGKPLFVCIGSPLAGMRGWIHSHDENTATCVSGRLGVFCHHAGAARAPAKAEIDAFRQFVDTGSSAAAFDINAICKLLKTRHVVCCNVRESQGHCPARGRRAAVRLLPRHSRRRFARAFCTATRRAWSMARSRDSSNPTRIWRQRRKAANGDLVTDATRKVFNTNILDFVEHVSQSEGATPGSVISFEEEARQQSRWAKLWRLTKIAFDVLPVFKYLLSVAAAIIALYLIDVGLDVLAYFGYDVELPDKSWMRMLLRR